MNDRVLSVHYDGAKPLKGVLGGVDYPVFWLDLSAQDSLVRFEDGLSPTPSVDRDRLREFCLRFFEVHNDYTFPPFIVSKSEQHLTNLPVWYLDELKALIKNFEESSQTSLEGNDENAAETSAEQLREFLDHLDKLLKTPPNSTEE